LERESNPQPSGLPRGKIREALDPRPETVSSSALAVGRNRKRIGLDARAGIRKGDSCHGSAVPVELC
jgi:hypothetical protein